MCQCEKGTRLSRHAQKDSPHDTDSILQVYFNTCKSIFFSRFSLLTLDQQTLKLERE